MSNSLKNHLYAVISGKSEVRHGKIIQTIANYIRESQRTSTTSKGSKLYKEQEKQKLESYISKNRLWINHIDFNQYVSDGAFLFTSLSNSFSLLCLRFSFRVRNRTRAKNILMQIGFPRPSFKCCRNNKIQSDLAWI